MTVEHRRGMFTSRQCRTPYPRKGRTSVTEEVPVDLNTIGKCGIPMVVKFIRYTGGRVGTASRTSDRVNLRAIKYTAQTTYMCRRTRSNRAN